MILDLMAESLYSCLSNIPGPLGSITQQVELFERVSLLRIFQNLNVKIRPFSKFHKLPTLRLSEEAGSYS